MSSTYFRIEVYGKSWYGCPELDLMGYVDINELIEDCWKAYHKIYPRQEEVKG